MTSVPSSSCTVGPKPPPLCIPMGFLESRRMRSLRKSNWKPSGTSRPNTARTPRGGVFGGTAALRVKVNSRRPFCKRNKARIHLPVVASNLFEQPTAAAVFGAIEDHPLILVGLVPGDFRSRQRGEELGSDATDGEQVAGRSLPEDSFAQDGVRQVLLLHAFKLTGQRLVPSLTAVLGSPEKLVPPLASDRKDQDSTLQLQNVAAGGDRTRPIHSLQIFEPDSVCLPTVPLVGGTIEITLGMAFPVAPGLWQQMSADEEGAIGGHREISFPSQHIEFPALGPASASIRRPVEESVLFGNSSLPGCVERHQQQLPAGQPGDAGLVVLRDADGNTLPNQLGLPDGSGIGHPDRVVRLESPGSTTSRGQSGGRDGYQDKGREWRVGRPAGTRTVRGRAGRSG